MKTFIAKITVAMAALTLPLGLLNAQTFTDLHSFEAANRDASTSLLTNGDGAYLYARLTLSGSTLYGVASGDSSNGLGGVFRINTDGTGFTNLFAFEFITGGDNGSGPLGELVLSGQTLYGTTRSGGTNYNGSIFAIQTDGSGFTNLHYFSGMVSNINSDGASPETGLVLSGGTLYGTTYAGGSNGDGVVFAINTNGTGFTNLFNFAGTNGQNPQGLLVVAGNTLYGTTLIGGSGTNTNGTIFAIHTDGTGFASYHNFSPLGYPSPANSDGARPKAGMVLVGTTLYGTTSAGGAIGNGYGSIFAIGTNGTGFHNVVNFNFYQGAGPLADLIFTNGVLYGTTTSGGANSAGTVFSVNPDGTEFTNLYSFPLAHYSGTAYTNTVGAEPWAGVVYSGGALFGVTPLGGAGGVGTVYGLSLGSSAPAPIPLTVQWFAGELILSWSDSTFSLQASPGLGQPFVTLAGATSPYTVSPTNVQEFFRLESN